MKYNKPVDVVLIYPKTDMDLGNAVAPPFSVLTVAAPIYNKGIRVKIIDQRVDPEWQVHLKEALKYKPICCGISSMTGRQILHGTEAAEIIRKETKGSSPIVWGGIHPTLVPEQTLRSRYVDVVCIGEGDETFADLVDALKRKRELREVKGIAFLDGDNFVFTGQRPFINIEELLPTPWDLVDVESYISPDLYLRESSRVLDIGQTSRGCPYPCIFCYSTAVHRFKWRAMSADKSLNMIVENVKRFNLDGIWLRDDEFFLDMERVLKICSGIIAKNLNISWYTAGARVTDILKASDYQLDIIKQSGASVMRFGAESGSNRVLEFLKKGQTVEQILEVNRRCKEFGIKPVYSLMCGMPTETFEEINETIDLFFRLQKENLNASLAPIYPYAGYPGTQLYNIAVEMGLRPPRRFEDWVDWVDTETAASRGKRTPWLNKQEQQWVNNLSYLSLLSFSGSGILSIIKNKPFAGLINLVAQLCSKYFRWRLKIKLYHFVPEIKPLIMASQIYMRFVIK